MTRDPVPGAPSLPTTLNPYAYGRNNPALYVDPSGKFAFIPLLIVGLAGGALGGLGYYAIQSYMHPNPCTGQMNWDWNQAAFWSGAGAALGAAIGAGIYGGLWVGAQLGWWGQTTATTVATAACADGDCTNEIRSTVRLFRAVSETEFQQIMRTGEFETLGSTEGKYFATTLENAKVWGQQLMGEGNFRVVQVDIPAKAVADFYAFPFLDRIGPAYFATMDQLQKLSLTIEEAMQ